MRSARRVSHGDPRDWRGVSGMARRSAAVALLLAALVLAAPLRAAESAPAEEGWGVQLGNELMSPYCPGRTLPDCPSGQAAELRQWIVAQEKAGRPRSDVESELLARYGEEILQAPRARGFAITAYLLPVLAFLGGGIVVAIFLRRQGRRTGVVPAAATTSTPGPAPRAVSSDVERLLEDELAGRR